MESRVEKYYAGIGSRETPGEVLGVMEALARKLAAEGWTLRSGHAVGADRAFERGAGGKAVIYLPWPGFGVDAYVDRKTGDVDGGMKVLGEAFCDREMWTVNFNTLVEKYRLYPWSSNRAVQALHGRNVAQVRGHLEPLPENDSRMVVCYCREVGGVPQGGTATAVKLARHLGISVRNLWHPEALAAAKAWLTS